jgi:hypothetical protein
MSLEQIFKSKGKDTYCMYLRVKKSSLQSEILAIEKQIEPLRNISLVIYELELPTIIP